MNRSARARSSAVSLAAAALVVAVGCAAAAAPPSPSTNRTIAAPASVASVAPSPSKAPAASAQASPAGPQVTSMPSAPDSGVVVKLTSSLIHWSESQISAPAAKAWHVEITVKDGSGTAVAVFLGRGGVRGMTPGRRVILEGVAIEEGAEHVVYNPGYELLP